MDRPGPELISGDVLLRRWRAGDAALAFAMVTESLEHLSPWMPWAAGYSIGAAREFTAGCERDWDAGLAFNYLITTGGVPAGSAALMARIGRGGLEIGYWVHRDHVRRGIATAAAGALTEAALGLPGTGRTEIWHDLSNVASGRVPLRLGYERAGRAQARFGLAPGDSGTSVIWRMTR